MFYAPIVLGNKKSMAKVWLVAHWGATLKKTQILETDIEQSVDCIMLPEDKLALRTSGQLLLGAARIYSRKAKYLLDDCNEAIDIIKTAFIPDIVDLPEDQRQAAISAVTLTEEFRDFG